MLANQIRSPVHRIFEEAFNQGNLAVVNEVFTPDRFAPNGIGGGLNGPEDLKCLIAMLRTALPDLHCTVEGEIREGDRVAAHWTMSGTHLGLFMSNAPTGKQMKVRGMILVRLAHGTIVEHWMLTDQLGVLQQLGIVPR